MNFGKRVIRVLEDGQLDRFHSLSGSINTFHQRRDDQKLGNISPFYSGAVCGILVPQPGIETGPMAVKVLSPNHWTAREFLGTFLQSIFRLCAELGLARELEKCDFLPPNGTEQHSVPLLLSPAGLQATEAAGEGILSMDIGYWLQ